MLKKKIVFATVVLIITLLGMFTFIVLNCSSYSVYINEPQGEHYSNIRITYSENDVVEHIEPVHEDGYLKITFYSLNKGTTTADIIYSDTSGGSYAITRDFTVSWFNVLYNSVKSSLISNMNGYPVYYVTAVLFFSVMAVYMILLFKKCIKRDMYSYSTVFNCGLMIMFIGLALFFAALSVYFILNYRDYQADTMRDLTSIIFLLIILLSIPIVFIYALSMTVSNIWLIRHEGFRVANALGIAISIAMILGIGFCLFLPTINYIWNPGRRAFTAGYAVICSLFAFFEIYLLSASICALIAAKHKPAFDKDYIIILGCGIKKDGTLLPLIRGRVDKAIEFYHNQLNATGKKAVFVPSGGQGSDEIISEGEAMRRYLLERGIPEEQIMPETSSANTLENMKFSKALISDSSAKVAFSTTNYHVFRSGIFANQAGLKAEGMGSKTKWYFWPNAFIREFIGLVVSQKIKLIVLAVTIAAICGVISILTL